MTDREIFASFRRAYRGDIPWRRHWAAVRGVSDERVDRALRLDGFLKVIDMGAVPLLFIGGGAIYTLTARDAPFLTFPVALTIAWLWLSWRLEWHRRAIERWGRAIDNQSHRRRLRRLRRRAIAWRDERDASQAEVERPRVAVGPQLAGHAMDIPVSSDGGHDSC